MRRATIGWVGGLVLSLSSGGCGRSDLLLLDEVGADESDTAGDGDPSTTTTGDGDGDPSTTTTGDGDGDPSTTTTGDGDGDPSTTTTGDGDGDPTTAGDGDGECVDLIVALAPDPAKVLVLVDQGAHMGGGFDGTTRLAAVETAMVDPDLGVAWTWQAQRQLGLFGFTSFNGDFGGACPVMVGAAMGLNNADGIVSVLAGMVPEDENPVADAIEAVIPEFAGEPGRLILVTGRNPDTCAQPNPQQGFFQAGAATQAAAEAGIETHLIAVGTLNSNYAQALANIGIGLDPQSPELAPWTNATTVDELRTSLDGLIAEALTCGFDLDAPIDPVLAAECTVSLDGQLLGLDDPDGWTVPDLGRLELGGAGCAAYQAGASVEMLCGCG